MSCPEICQSLLADQNHDEPELKPGDRAAVTSKCMSDPQPLKSIKPVIHKNLKRKSSKIREHQRGDD